MARATDTTAATRTEGELGWVMADPANARQAGTGEHTPRRGLTQGTLERDKLVNSSRM